LSKLCPIRGHAALSGHPARIWDTKRDASQLINITRKKEGRKVEIKTLKKENFFLLSSNFFLG
jgi:hypothetical protein